MNIHKLVLFPCKIKIVQVWEMEDPYIATVFIISNTSGIKVKL